MTSLFGIAFLWDWNENRLFQSCGHCWVFQICWHFECSFLTASSFRIWNSSTGIPSPPLALFRVMLPNDHLTWHAKMSGSSGVNTVSWLSGSWRFFLYSSSVYSCHLYLIWEINMQVKKQQLELNMEQQTGSKLRKERSTSRLYVVTLPI